jgi:integrase
MTVFFDKIRGQYCYDFQFGGRRYRGRCVDAAGAKITGKRAAVQMEAEARARAKISGKLPRAGELTLGEILNVLSETWQHQPDWKDRRRYVREILAFFGPARRMADIDGAMVQDYIRDALDKPIMVWVGGSNRKTTDADAKRFFRPAKGKKRTAVSVNRSLQVLRAAFRRAHETRDPITRRRAVEDIPAIGDLKEGKRKATPIPDDVIVELFRSLPQHLAEAIRATLYFGFRRGEVFNLQIEDVDFLARGVRLYAENVKDDEDAFIPGGPEAMTFLAQLVAQAKERHTPYLITWRRHRKDAAAQAAEKWCPIINPRSSWRRVMNRIEAKFGRRWRWHDLRAAYITYVAMTAGPMAAQRLARHSDFKTTQGYVEVADKVMRAGADSAAARPALALVMGGEK